MASEKDATCENDPNFAVICAFFQKFSHMLNIQHLDFCLLQKWLENTDEVTEGLKLLHIKLLRKLRKTVHESAWETALSKFCFGYSAQDAWEIERFGYKKSSLKVKLRILKELVESQFQRNGKFRNSFTAMNADELRSQPVGRDKLGHSYWLTQDPNLNLRIYQEHLDEEIWQVVASNREELVTLISRLKGNEVVLPSLVGIVDEDTSSSNSCPLLVKPPPPEEKEDESQEEIVIGTTNTAVTTIAATNEGKVPNIKIKLDTFTIERKCDDSSIKKEKSTTNGNEDQSDGAEEESEEEAEEEDEGEEEEEEMVEEEEDEIEGEDGDEETVEDDVKESQKIAVNRNSKRNESKTGVKDKRGDDEKSSKKLTEKNAKQHNADPESREIDANRSLKEENVENDTNEKSVIIEKTKDEEMKENSDNKSKSEEIRVERKVKPIVISQSKNLKIDEGQSTKKRTISEVNEDDQKDEEEDLVCNAIKKPRPTLLNSAVRGKKVSKYEKYSDDDDDEEDEEEGEEEEEDDEEEEEEEEEDEGSDDEVPVEDEIEEETMIVKGEGNGEMCRSGNFLDSINIDLYKEEENENIEIGEAIEEDIMIFRGEGNGEDCLVGNSKDETTETTDKSNFYFGQPGCLKLSPIKKIEIEKTKGVIDSSNENSDKMLNSDEDKKEVEDLKNGEGIKDTKEKVEQTSDKNNEINELNAIKDEIKEEEHSQNKEVKENSEKITKLIEENDIEELSKSTKDTPKEALENLKIEEFSGKISNINESRKSPEKSESTPVIVTKVVKSSDKLSIEKEESSKKPSLSNDLSKHASATGRKRRLSENSCEKQLLKQFSESETDVNSENIEELVADIDLEDEGEVGGKRLKMRSKLVNSEIRKKVEARRNDVEKETSSSSEAELPRKRTLAKKIEIKTSPTLSPSSTGNLKENVEEKEKEEEKSESKDEVKVEGKKCSEDSAESTKNEILMESKETESSNKSSLEQQVIENDQSAALIDATNTTTDELKVVNIPDEENVQPPAKTTRSTRRSTAEPLFQDLPQPKRKARGSGGGPRKNNNSKAAKEAAARIKQEQLQQQQQQEETSTGAGAGAGIKSDDSVPTQTTSVSCSKNTNLSTDEKENLLSNLQTKEEIQNETTTSTQVNEKPRTEEVAKNEEEKTNDNSETNQNDEQSTSNVSQEPLAAPPKKKQQRRKREIDESNIIPEADIAPIRQSRRIAQLKIKEEAERRKLEEIALKKMKEELKKKKKEESKLTGKPLEASEHSESSKEVDSEIDVKKKVERKRKKRTGWSSCTESEAEEEEEELIFGHHESDRCSPLFKSDHEFSPESELEDSSEVVPLKRARTARKEGEVVAEDVEDDQACQKCGKKDHPEWILLCDKCDKGYHCSCLSPVLFIIPEGDWFCPPCQQEQLILALENHLKEFDELLEKKKEDEIKKQLALKAAQEAEEARVARRARNIQRQRNRKHYSRRDNSEEEEDNDDDEEEEDEEGDDDRDLRKGKEVEKRTKKKRKVRGRSYESRSFSSRSSSKSFSSSSNSTSGSSSSSQSADSDDEPIYKLRKRRQVNVSYRFNEFDDLINSAIKDEMDEVAGAGNLGRGKDISTIIEADKEEKLRQKQLEEEAAKRELMLMEKPKIEIESGEILSEQQDSSKLTNNEECTLEEQQQQQQQIKMEDALKKEDSGSDFEPIKRKPKMNNRNIKKKKSRKLNCLDISSEDDGSDEDFKTSSYETEEDEEESLSVRTESESSLELYKKKSKNKKPKKTRRAARRAARNRKKQYEYDSDFVVDTDASEDIPLLKKKRKEDSDYTESMTDEDDLSEDVDSDELCDDSTDSDESDGAWKPSKRKKQKTIIKRKPQKHRIIPSGKHKKIKRKDETEKSFKMTLSKNKIHDDEDSLDSGRKTRGKRFTYLEDYEEESSDDGIKPGVKRPDTPPEEREEFIRKQEEIKRMLAEKNTEAAKVVATPIPKTPSEKRSTTAAAAAAVAVVVTTNVVEATDSLSTVPLSVIKGAKALDIDYLQRRGELHESDEQETDDFDDDLPDDFNPEDMDEEAIAKMMEEEDFAQQQLKLAGEAIQKKKAREMENSNRSFEVEPPKISRPSGPILQEPPRKRLPMPTIQPPLIRNAPQNMMHNLQATSSRINIAPQRLIAQNLIRPPPHIIPPTSGNVSVLSSAKDFRSITPPSPTVSVAGRQIHVSSQQQPNELEKPRGRRKKITPLRDTLQKQQAAAAAAAAAVTAAAATAATAVTVVKTTKDSVSDKPLIGMPTGSNLSIAQPPQLYKPAPNTQPSVITRMPQPPRPRFPDQSSRFYPPPSQLLHRTPQRLPGMPLPPHPSLRPSYVTGPPPLRPASNSGPSPVSIGNGLSRHPFGSPEQYPRARQPPIHPPYRPPLYGTPGYPPAPLPQQLSSPQQSSSSQTPSQLSPHQRQQSSPHPQATPPLHSPSPNTIHSGTNNYPVTSYATGPFANFYSSHSASQQLTTAHSTPPIATAVPSSVIVSAGSIAAQQQQQQQQQQSSIPDAPAPPPPPPSPAATASPIVTEVRPKASVLETFNTKSNPSSLETESNEPPDDNDEESDIRPANAISEFSGLVSYFSSQQDDLDT